MQNMSDLDVALLAIMICKGQLKFHARPSMDCGSCDVCKARQELHARKATRDGVRPLGLAA